MKGKVVSMLFCVSTGDEEPGAVLESDHRSDGSIMGRYWETTKGTIIFPQHAFDY